MSWQSDLMEAIEDDDLELAAIALAEGASPDGVDDKGRTPLSCACSEEAVCWLLSAGAHVAAERPRDGCTSLHAAAASGALGRLAALLEADGRCALERFDDRGMTPLICAVEARHMDAVTFLLEAGADVNAHDYSTGGDSALIWAVTGKDGAMVKLLLEARADPDHRGDFNKSAYHRACEWAESKRHPELRAIYELLARAHRR
jgi:ankyrin repeat protein